MCGISVPMHHLEIHNEGEELRVDKEIVASCGFLGIRSDACMLIVDLPPYPRNGSHVMPPMFVEK